MILDLAAPVAGRVVPLRDVPDPAFASGALGPGAAVEPSEPLVVAPVAGTVVAALPHAYGLLTDEGVEVLVHVGIDTVNLDGAHFDMHVRRGDRVVAGDALVTVDLAAVVAEGYSTATVVVVTGWSAAREVLPVATGSVTTADVLLRVAV